jgi:hypothetical protein
MAHLISLAWSDLTEHLQRSKIAGKRTRMKRRHLNIAASHIAILCLAACNSSPAQNMFGSFFPAWMLCTAAGVAGAVILRQVLSTLGINQYLIAPPLTYLCIAVAGTLLVWLLWFGH